jgi:hypothetical protein
MQGVAKAFAFGARESASLGATFPLQGIETDVVGRPPREDTLAPGGRKNGLV